MSKKIVDVVAWAVGILQQENFDGVDIFAMMEKGFTSKEISIAFSWLSSKINTKELNEVALSVVNPPQSFRFLTEEEKNLFTEEGYNTIKKLISVGLIKSWHLDMIFKRAEYFGHYKINDEAIRQFVAFFIFDIPYPEENIVRLNFDGDESIN